MYVNNCSMAGVCVRDGSVKKGEYEYVQEDGK